MVYPPWANTIACVAEAIGVSTEQVAPISTAIRAALPPNPQATTTTAPRIRNTFSVLELFINCVQVADAMIRINAIK